MKASDKKQIKQWMDTWERAGSALKEIKRRGLQGFDYAKNQAIIDEMLQWAHGHRKVRLTSGLVEQQRYFMKIKDRKRKKILKEL